MANQLVSVKGIPCLYCYHYKNGGKRYFVKTQCKCRIVTRNLKIRSRVSYSELKHLAAQTVRNLKETLLSPRKIQDYVEDYIIVRQLKSKSAKAYRRILSQYTFDPVQNAIEMAKTLQSGVNVCQITRAVKSFFSWLNQNGLTIANPAANIKLPQSRIRHRTLSPKEIRMYYRTLSNCSLELQLFGRLLLETGARVSSIYAICKSDLTSQGLFLHNIKCDRDYALAIPLSKDTLDLWYKYLSAHPNITPDGQIFITKFSVLNKHLRDLLNHSFNQNNSGERVVIHTLRHTAATLALQNGVPIDMVSCMLDHVNIQTTMRIYAKVSQNQINHAYRKLFASLYK